MNGNLSASTVTVRGAGGDEVQAYLAGPDGDGRRGGVVVIHHMPGYDRASKEITRRFAELGYDAICPNLHYREAPGAAPDDAAAVVRASGGVPDDRLVGDVGEHVDEFEHLLKGNGKAYEFHRYDDAGHGFFAVDRAMYRVAAANDGWERIAAFYATHLA